MDILNMQTLMICLLFNRIPILETLMGIVITKYNKKTQVEQEI